MRQRLGAPAQHVDQPGLVERRVGVRRAGEAGDAAGERGGHLRFERRLVLVARLAQARGEVDEARRDDQALGIDDAVGLAAFRRNLPVSDENVADAVLAAGWIDDPSVLDVKTHQLPATMLITAMRTAMPKVTCGRITECGPSATVESISTPRFIGPGCMTIASRFASASFSAVRP
jgi:hypothetical protein